ncbi:MAG: FecR domain-containing protein, partial [Chloroflexi bacterium]|nr:FecR domain-containing protein [Chloroflexota bacterium]
ADVSLDDFVISDDGITSATINVLKGAFRFVSGKSPEGTFKIKTPLSTIGIRGTMFDIYVKERGATDVILYSGKVNVCTSANRCRLLSRNCDIVRITSPRNIGFRKFLRSRNRASENRDYNLVADQERFQKSWRAPIRQCSDRASRMDLDERMNEQGEGVDGLDPSRDGSSRSSAAGDPGDDSGVDPGDGSGGLL